MATLKSLLDAYGTPPPEICLDWAWQLEKLSRDSMKRQERSTEELPSHGDGLGRPARAPRVTTGRTPAAEPRLAKNDDATTGHSLGWDEIAVDASGQLELSVADKPCSCDALVSQLVVWSAGAAISCNDTGTALTQVPPARLDLNELRLATLRLVEEIQPDNPRMTPSSSEIGGVATDEVAMCPIATSRRKDSPESMKLGSAQTSAQPRILPANKRIREGSRAGFRKKHILGLVALIGIFGAVCMLLPSARQSTPPAGEPKSALASERIDPRALSTIRQAGDSQFDVEQGTNNRDISLSSTDSIVALETGIGVSPSPLETTPSTLSLVDLPPSPLEQTSSSATGISLASSGSPKAKNGAESPLTTERTVVEEIQNSARQAEATFREIDLRPRTGSTATETSPQPAAAPALGALPPLKIECESMRQIFKLKDLEIPKPKDPTWRMRLDVSDGFVVEPSGIQLLSPLGSVHWLVYDSQAKSPRTRIIVQAQQAGGRKGDVQWRLFGNAEDLPALNLPLARQWLDPLRNRLKQFDQFIQLKRNELLTEGKRQGLSSNSRSLIGTQRKWADQQDKILKRCLIVIAETDRLVGLVDGQFQIHAQLQDGAGENAPALLTYGSMEAQANEQ